MTEPLTCPQCGVPMRTELSRDVSLDTCACGGIWFDRDELDSWFAAIGSNRTVSGGRLPGAPADGGPYRCPRCADDTLDSSIVDDVLLANCSSCGGIWVTPEGIAILRSKPNVATTVSKVPQPKDPLGGIDFMTIISCI